jgi:hypothetical protein
LAGSFVCGEIGTSLVIIISAGLLRSGTTVIFSYVIGKCMWDLITERQRQKESTV